MPRTITVCDSAPATGRLPDVRCAVMAAEQIDFAAEGLLEGLEGEARAERLALLEYLAAEGVPLAELRRATATGTLMFLPAERVIGGERALHAAEVAELSGVGEDFLAAVSRAMGLPVPSREEAVYTESDLESAAMTNWPARRASPTRRSSTSCASSAAGSRRRRRRCGRFRFASCSSRE